MGKWGKRLKVPPEFKEYSAAYRHGYEEFSVRSAPRGGEYFKADGAHEAYRAGFSLAKREQEVASE